MTTSIKKEIKFNVEINKNKNLYEVIVSNDDVKSVMPARTQDEALQVAISSVSGFAQFVLSQSL